MLPCPLIQLPSSFLLAMATALLPAISQAAAQRQQGRLKKAVSQSLLFTCVASYGAAAFFVLYAEEICQLIYGDASLGAFLRPLGFLAPLSYLHITLNGICNGLNQQKFSFFVHTASSLLSIACIYWGLPHMGIMACFLSMVLSLCFSCGCFLVRFGRSDLLECPFSSFFLLPALALTLAYLVTRLLPAFSFPQELQTLFCGGVFFLVYGLCLMLSGVLDEYLPALLRRKK